MREGAATMREQVRTADGILTLSGFYLLMDGLAVVRRRLTSAVLSGEEPSSADIDTLENSLKELKQLPRRDGQYQLALGPESGSGLLGVDLKYEMGELAKDLIYLRDGEDALVASMAAATPGFVREVEVLAGYVGNESYACFVTDRGRHGEQLLRALPILHSIRIQCNLSEPFRTAVAVNWRSCSRPRLWPAKVREPEDSGAADWWTSTSCLQASISWPGPRGANTST